MQTIVPNYYDKFACIAEKCTHNCCIGWEVDIDEETRQFYNMLTGELGEKIRENIEGEIPHFILGKDDRCPFLNDNGLCDIICEYGDGAICDICYLHPRFRNFYSSFEEMGLGLCCEEAARIILGEEEPFFIESPDKADDKEFDFLQRRQEIFNLLQNRDKNVKERFDELAKMFGFEFDFSLRKLCEVYLSLERLDESWTSEIKGIENFSFDCEIFKDEDFQIFFEQLSVYFIFRHLNNAIDIGSYLPVIRVVCMSVYFIGALCAYHRSENYSFDFEGMCNLVRMYSSEIEYSENNIEKLLNN